MEVEFDGTSYFIDFIALESVRGFKDCCILRYKGIDEEFCLPVNWIEVFRIWMKQVEVEKISMDIDLVKHRKEKV